MTGTPCDTCSGHCCSRYSVEVTASDIRRIAGALDVAPGAFCATVPSWPGRCQVEPSLVDGRPVNLVLRQVAGTCRFFRPDAGGCGIYEVRPRSCAIYPFADDGRGRPLQRRDLICPSDWNVRLHATDAAADLAALADEIQVHNDLVRNLATTHPHDGLARHLDRLLAALPESARV